MGADNWGSHPGGTGNTPSHFIGEHKHRPDRPLGSYSDFAYLFTGREFISCAFFFTLIGERTGPNSAARQRHIMWGYDDVLTWHLSINLLTQCGVTKMGPLNNSLFNDSRNGIHPLITCSLSCLHLSGWNWIIQYCSQRVFCWIDIASRLLQRHWELMDFLYSSVVNCCWI